MPNHCYNQLHVRGRQEDVLRFMERVGYFSPEGKIFDFNAITPLTPLQREIDEYLQYLYEYPRQGKQAVGSYSNYFESSVAALFGPAAVAVMNDIPIGLQRWGTKWNAYDVQYMYDYQRHTLIIAFMTAWSPPTYVFDDLPKVFPTLGFEMFYFEQGMGFAGGMSISEWRDDPDDGKIESWATSNYRGLHGG